MLRYIALFLMLTLAACQAPSPPTPSATVPPQPTVVAARPTAAQSPSAAVAPSPSAAAPGPSPSPAAFVAAPSPSASVAATPPPVGSSRVDVLNSADAAFDRGDLTSASGLFERVLNTPPSGEQATQTMAINGLAHFRAIVALLALGREADARVHLDALQEADASAPMARLAAQLWDQYSMVGGVRGACTQVQPQIASEAGPTLQTLQSMGVNVDARTLCKVPTS